MPNKIVGFFLLFDSEQYEIFYQHIGTSYNVGFVIKLPFCLTLVLRDEEEERERKQQKGTGRLIG